jgi:hypothetical protein
MSKENVGLCNQCNARVPAGFLKRDGQVYIRKECPTHGATESLVSSDAAAWQAKRDLWQYVPEQPEVCTLKCDKCRHNHKPNLTFIDVTNHCNMHCPICIATIKGMGFDYNPPVEYFEKIFAEISRWDPQPVVQLFGGEPTVRDDLFDIIAAARKHGLRVSVTTNGLRLADEEYAKKFCETRVGVRYAFDGFSPDIYEKLRHNRPAYEKKLKGLENLKKYTRRKQAIISCIARGINDDHVAKLVQYVHDNRDWVSELLMIPLAETWDPKEFSDAKPNTLEDVEQIFRNAVGDDVEFIPAGLSYAMRIPRPFLRTSPSSEILLLAGVHPNCESMTVLLSDGKRYHGIGHYMNKPLRQAAAEFAAMCKAMEPELNKLDPHQRWQRLQGQWLLLKTLVPWALRTFSLWKLTGNNPPLALYRFLRDRAKTKWNRRFARDEAAAGRRKRGMLRVAMLPFEEQHSVDGTRLENCKACFPYEDPDTGRIGIIPACMWVPYRNEILRKISRKYGAVDAQGRRREAWFRAEGEQARTLPPDEQAPLERASPQPRA